VNDCAPCAMGEDMPIHVAHRLGDNAADGSVVLGGLWQQLVAFVRSSFAA